MFKFSVKNKSYQLPQTPYETAYNDGIQILELEKAYGGQNYNYKLRVLQMLSGCDELKDVVEEEIEAIFKGLPLFSGTSDTLLNDVVKMNGKLYGLVNLDELTGGEYVDIERVLDSAEDLSLAASSLSALLYRPIKTINRTIRDRLINLRISMIKSRFIKPYACKNYTLEPHNLKASDKRVEDVEQYFSYGNCLSTLAYYLHWKQALAKEYYILFPEKDEKKDKREGEAKKKINMSTIWGMYHQFGLMTEKDLKEVNYLKSRPIKEIMFHLSYMIQSNNFEKNNK